MSEFASEGIRVSVETQYIEDQSSAKERRYVFAYRIVIANVGDAPATLRSRHWVIVDGTGNVREVKGRGVVGNEPRLRPGESFEYTSGCVLPTSRGRMHGTYQMVRDDESEFEASIAPFELRLPNNVN